MSASYGVGPSGQVAATGVEPATCLYRRAECTFHTWPLRSRCAPVAFRIGRPIHGTPCTLRRVFQQPSRPGPGVYVGTTGSRGLLVELEGFEPSGRCCTSAFTTIRLPWSPKCRGFPTSLTLALSHSPGCTGTNPLPMSITNNCFSLTPKGLLCSHED